jgi:hypothetical protein
MHVRKMARSFKFITQKGFPKCSHLVTMVSNPGSIHLSIM